MSFNRLRSHRKASTCGIRVSLRKIGGIKARRKVCITLGPDVLETTGWECGEQIEVLTGAGDDLGKLVLRRGREESYRLRWFGDKIKNKDKLTLQIWRWEPLPDETKSIEDCAFRIFEDGNEEAVEITLPVWAGRPPIKYEDDPRPVANSKL